MCGGGIGPMIDHTLQWAMAGLVCIGIGGALRMYMNIRVRGWAGYFARQTGLMESYKRLVADCQAPRWPLATSYLRIAIGIVVMFGAILWSK
jgi:hypothetical protein